MASCSAPPLTYAPRLLLLRQWLHDKHFARRTLVEIKQFVEEFAQAARNAVHDASGEGVETHGYLIEQSIQDEQTHGLVRQVHREPTQVCGFALGVIDAPVGAQRLRSSQSLERNPRSVSTRAIQLRVITTRAETDRLDRR